MQIRPRSRGSTWTRRSGLWESSGIRTTIPSPFTRSLPSTPALLADRSPRTARRPARKVPACVTAVTDGQKSTGARATPQVQLLDWCSVRQEGICQEGIATAPRIPGGRARGRDPAVLDGLVVLLGPIRGRTWPNLLWGHPEPAYIWFPATQQPSGRTQVPQPWRPPQHNHRADPMLAQTLPLALE